MVIKRKGIFGGDEIKPFSEKEKKAWKWPIRIGLAFAVIAFIGWTIYTTPWMNKIATNFAITILAGLLSAVESSATQPPAGANPAANMPVAPTPTPGIGTNEIKTALATTAEKDEYGGQKIDTPDGVAYRDKYIEISGVNVLEVKTLMKIKNLENNKKSLTVSIKNLETGEVIERGPTMIEAFEERDMTIPIQNLKKFEISVKYV